MTAITPADVLNSSDDRRVGATHLTTLTMRIRRYNPQVSADPWWDEFTIQVDPYERLVEALHEVKWHHDGTLTFLAIDARRIECGNEAPLAVLAVRDATDIHDLAARFAFVADHDLLTSLLNRRGFESRVVEALARSVRYGDTGAVDESRYGWDERRGRESGFTVQAGQP